MNVNTYSHFRPRPDLDYDRTHIHRGHSEEMRYPLQPDFATTAHAHRPPPFPITSPAPSTSSFPSSSRPSWQGSAPSSAAEVSEPHGHHSSGNQRWPQRGVIDADVADDWSYDRFAKRPRTLPESDTRPLHHQRPPDDRIPGPSTVTKVSDLLSTPRSPRLSSAGPSSDVGANSAPTQPMTRKEERKLRRMYQACVRCRRKKLKVRCTGILDRK